MCSVFLNLKQICKIIISVPTLLFTDDEDDVGQHAGVLLTIAIYASPKELYSLFMVKHCSSTLKLKTN